MKPFPLVLAWAALTGMVAFGQGRQNNRDLADKIDQLAQDAFVARAQVEALRKDVADLQDFIMKAFSAMHFEVQQNRITDQPTALWRFDPATEEWCVLAVSRSLSKEEITKMSWCKTK